MRNLILMSGCLLLAACDSGGSADADGDGTITGEEVSDAVATMDAPEAGRWETTAEVTEIAMPGLPAGMEDMAKSMYADMFGASAYCLTEEQAAKNPDTLWKEAQGNCTWEKFDRSEGDVSAKAVCTNDDGSKGAMEMDGSYTPTSYDSTNRMTFAAPQGEGSVTVHVTGKHVGACDGSETEQG